MFKKLQLKLILIYTMVLIAILLVSNGLIYIVFSTYNTNQIATDVEEILFDINSSEWIMQTYDINEKPQEIEVDFPFKQTDDDEIEEDGELNEDEDNLDTDNADDPQVSNEPEMNNEDDISQESDSPNEPGNTSEPSEQEEPEESNEPIESQEATETPEPAETEEPEESEEDTEDEDTEDSEVTNLRYGNSITISEKFINAMVSLELQNQDNSDGETEKSAAIKLADGSDLFIPEILNSFSYYFIFSNLDELLEWKSSDSNLVDKMYSISLNLKSNQSPELIDLRNENEGVYLVLKRPIIVDGKQLGFFSIIENVSAAYNTLDNLKLVMLIVTLVGILLSLVLGYIFAGRAIKPIKEAYKTKETFIGDASHELRIPLSIILLSMEALKRRNTSKDEQTEEIIEDVKGEALNMKDLVEKLLFIARNDSKSINLNFEKINLTNILDNNVEKYRKLGKEKNLTIDKDIPNNIMIQGDIRMIDSVISILLDNAEKYNKAGGSILVKAQKVRHERKPYIKVSVQDSGIGIKKEELDKVFERFYRQEKSRAKTIPGYGLGLPIAKEIVDRHNGQIEIESIEGLGTTCTILLPESV